MKKLLYVGNRLSQKGKTVTSIETLGNLLEQEGYTVYKTSSRSNKVLRLLDMLYTTFNRRNDVDYVLIDTYSTLNFWYAYAVGRLCQVLSLPYIPILRGGDLPKRLHTHPKACQRLFKNAQINVSPSPYLMEVFRQAGISNLKLIPNTLELDRYPFRQRAEIRPKILWVRAFDAIYNPMMALEVLQFLLKSNPKAELCMVGPDKDGSLGACQAFAIEHQLPVTFTGKLEKAAWIDMAADYDIFLNTTTIDNTPVSVMEAMALGLPVVSTRVGGIPYLLTENETALLVPSGDVFACSQAIRQLLDDPKKAQQIASNARGLVATMDWQTVKSQWFELFN
ncbi:glycosyltransferase family 4 protein [Croceiramulus getboli]|nr:glycosyltransferase family 4 protein [Flavobacteriaceae bacterium YJPT1-3]